MEFSACTAVFGMAGLKKIVDTSIKLEHDAVELTATPRPPAESTPERREEVLGWIHDAGIVYSTLHYIFDGAIRLLDTDSEMMNQSTVYLKQVMDVAYDMECPTVIMGSDEKTRSFEPDQDREAGVKCITEVMHQVDLYAQKKGVTLAVEAVNQYETNFLNTLGEAINFVNTVNLPSMRTMVNTYHLDIEGVDPAETIHNYGHTSANLHLADSNRQAPGDGHLNFAPAAEALREVDFRGYCSFEVFGLYPWKLWYDIFEESVEHMGNDIRYTRPIFG